MIVVPYNICCALSVGATLVVAQFSFHMSPLWGFGYLVHAACYKHSAPLGLNAPAHQNSRHGIHRRGEVSSPDGLGNPTPTVSIPLFSAFLPLGVIALNIPSRITRTHVAPLGLWLLGHAAVL